MTILRFGIRSIFAATLWFALYFAIARVNGWHRALNLMGVMTWIIALVVLALLPGPKKLGISSVLAILAFFAMRPLAYPSEQALQVLICVGLEVTAFVLWVYLAIRAVLAGNSSNIRLGILSLLGLLSPMGLTMLLRIWAAIAIQLGLSSDIRYNPFYWLLSILWY